MHICWKHYYIIISMGYLESAQCITVRMENQFTDITGSEGILVGR